MQVDTLPANCPVNLVVKNMEVNQAIQTWNNSVPFVKDKITYVRAFITTCADEPSLEIPVKAQLHGYRYVNGQKTKLKDSPLKPENGSAIGWAWPEATSGDIEKNGRKEMNSSLNFRLPPAWRSGTVDLELERLDGNRQFVCNTGSTSNGRCLKTIAFNAVPKPEIQIFRVDWTDSSGNTWKLSTEDVRELKKRLIAVYPISGLEFIPARRLNYGIMPPDGPRDKNAIQQNKDLLFVLMLQRELDGCTPEKGCNRIYYGALPQGSRHWGGFANGIPSLESWGSMSIHLLAFGRNTHAHEIGHNLGLEHAALEAAPNALVATGVCCEICEIANPKAPPFKYFFPDRLTIDPCTDNACDPELVRDYGATCGGTKAFISDVYPSDPQKYLSYGFNTYFLPKDRVVDPEKHFELMSYCGRTNVKGDGWRWVSDITYNKIYTILTGSTITSPSPGIPEAYYLVPGWVDFRTDAVNLRPFNMITRDVMPAPPLPGEYSLLALDSAQNVIQQIDFKPQVPVADFPQDDGRNYGTFMIPIPADPRINQVKIVHNGNTLVSRLRSQNAPIVNILFPTAGSSLDHATEVLRWEASDTDNDPLTYAVQYSFDGGTSWETLVVNWPETTYQVDMGSIRGTTTGRFRVLASDGFNVGTGNFVGLLFGSQSCSYCGSLLARRTMRFSLLTNSSAWKVQVQIVRMAFFLFRALSGGQILMVFWEPAGM